MPTAHPFDHPSLSRQFFHSLLKRKNQKTFTSLKPIAWMQSNSASKTRCSTWLKTSRRSRASTPTTWAASQTLEWVQSQRPQANFLLHILNNKTMRECSWTNKTIWTKYIKIKMTYNNKCTHTIKLTTRTGKSKSIGNTRILMGTFRTMMWTTRWGTSARKKSKMPRVLEKMDQGDRVITQARQYLLSRASSKRHGVQINSRQDWLTLRD